MDLLLDTHTFIWWRDQDARLSASARNAIADPYNAVSVSAVTVWEIAIKRRANKLVFTGSPSAAVIANGFTEVAILPADAEAAGDLNWRHKDPFDRLLAVQATRLGAVLVTADKILQQSQVPILRAD